MHCFLAIVHYLLNSHAFCVQLYSTNETATIECLRAQWRLSQLLAISSVHCKTPPLHAHPTKQTVSIISEQLQP